MATKPAALKTVEDRLGEIATLHTAMASAFAEIEAATKDKTNPHFKSKYADLGSVIDAVKGPLIKYGLFFTQRSHPAGNGVSVETVLHHSGGEQLSLGILFVPANKQDAQGFGSALTYARRYGLMTAFGVPAEDDDGNAASRSAPARATNGNGFDDPKPTDKELATDFSPTALRGAIKTLVRNINGCGSVRDLEELLELADAKDTMEQCERRFPSWWATGVGCPAEFVPLKQLIAQTRAGLAALEPVG